MAALCRIELTIIVTGRRSFVCVEPASNAMEATSLFAGKEMLFRSFCSFGGHSLLVRIAESAVATCTCLIVDVRCFGGVLVISRFCWELKRESAVELTLTERSLCR